METNRDKTDAQDGRSRADSLSRDPTDYIPTDRFVIRTKRQYGPVSETRTCPPIRPDVISRCIEHGDRCPAAGERVQLVATVAGVEWRLVVQPKEVGKNLVLTAISDAHNPATIDDRVINTTGEVLPE